MFSKKTEFEKHVVETHFRKQNVHPNLSKIINFCRCILQLIQAFDQLYIS